MLSEQDKEIVRWVYEKLEEMGALAHREAVSQPSEPAGLEDSAPGELVSRMLDAYYAEDGETRPSKWEGSAVISMTNALAIARAEFDQQLQQKLAERDKEWEQGIQQEWMRDHNSGIDAFLERCRARLCRKPSLQEQISKNLKEWRESDNFVIPAKDKAAEIIALVKAEKEPRQ